MPDPRRRPHRPPSPPDVGAPSAARPAATILRVRLGRRILGARGTETPTGRFAITDKLRGRPLGSEYGCCILALSGRQPKVRTGGLDGRMAIHGTTRPDLIGGRGSHGCLRAADDRLRRLARRVPVGTPVVIAR